MGFRDVTYLDPRVLHPHEHVDVARAREVLDQIERERLFHPPILVDRESRVILDGHHRWWASLELGCRIVPCCLIDYRHNRFIRVVSRRRDVEVTKDTVVLVGLSGAVYPPKTTRHVYTFPPGISPVRLDDLLPKDGGPDDRSGGRDHPAAPGGRSRG